MPAYTNVTAPPSLMPGDVGFSFNAETFPADGTAGAQFCVPQNFNFAANQAVRWQTLFGSSPSEVDIRLQGAMADVDSEYQDIDKTSSTSGEARTVVGVRSRFLRVKKMRSTGGEALTAKILV